VNRGTNEFPQRGHLILKSHTNELKNKNIHKFKRKAEISNTNQSRNNIKNAKAIKLGSFDTNAILFNAFLYSRLEAKVNPFKDVLLLS